MRTSSLPARSTPVAVPVTGSAPGIVTVTSPAQRGAPAQVLPAQPACVRVPRAVLVPPGQVPARQLVQHGPASSRSRRPGPPDSGQAGAARSGRAAAREVAAVPGGRSACPLPDVDPDADHDRGPGLLGEDAAQLRSPASTSFGHFRVASTAAACAHRGRGGDPGQQRQPAEQRGRHAAGAQQHRERERRPAAGWPSGGPAGPGRRSAPRPPGPCPRPHRPRPRRAGRRWWTRSPRRPGPRATGFPADTARPRSLVASRAGAPSYRHSLFSNHEE